MTFDGKKYKLASPVKAGLYQPHSTMQAQVMGENLRNTYFAAQQNARFVGQVVFPTNMISWLVHDYHIKSASLTKAAKINAYLAEGFTHLLCSVVYGVSSHYPTKIHHRMVITNASAETLTGETSIDERQAGRLPVPSLVSNSGTADAYRRGQAVCEVELEKANGPRITLNELFSIELQANAKNSINWQDELPEFGSTSLSWLEAEVYRPFFASFWLEARAL